MKRASVFRDSGLTLSTLTDRHADPVHDIINTEPVVLSFTACKWSFLSGLKPLASVPVSWFWALSVGHYCAPSEEAVAMGSVCRTASMLLVMAQ